MKLFLACVLAVLAVPPTVHAQNPAPDTTLSLSALPAGGGWAVFNRHPEAYSEPGRENAVYLDAQPGQGVAWVPGLRVGDAVVEVDVKGRDEPGRSFVGLAFYGADAERYEAVYLRPFNFRSDDPARRARAVQYVAVPSHEWPRLREHHPGQYEAAVPQGTAPDGWVRLRVELAGPSVQVYVDDSAEPVLSLDRIGASEVGWVGIWVGNRSDGSFANLRVRPLPETRP